MDTEGLLAEAAVLRVANRYASAVDRVDLDLLRSCFFADAQATYMGRVLPAGVEHIVEQLMGPRVNDKVQQQVSVAAANSC